MNVLITGIDGFIGRNLATHLSEREDVEILAVTRNTSSDLLRELVVRADLVFHLAGTNRPPDPDEFMTDNVGFTQQLIDAVRENGRSIPIVYTSSTQANLDNPYGCSKAEAENRLRTLVTEGCSPVYIFRLPNVFGKWARPNYNSVVATFCHNITHGLPIQINDPDASVTLVYIDDVIAHFVNIIDRDVAHPVKDLINVSVKPEYRLTVGGLASQLKAFRASRGSLLTEPVGTGLVRALYATYVSYLSVSDFSYSVVKHEDPRGAFVEMLKTKDSGQFSFFTAHPGVTRGGHYHHSKSEKFLVISGEANFRFRHIVTDEFYELVTSGQNPTIVETVPGWTHDITNIGKGELVVMLWANELFDKARPDTYTCPVERRA